MDKESEMGFVSLQNQPDQEAGTQNALEGDAAALTTPDTSAECVKCFDPKPIPPCKKCF